MVSFDFLLSTMTWLLKNSYLAAMQNTVHRTETCVPGQGRPKLVTSPTILTVLVWWALMGFGTQQQLEGTHILCSCYYSYFSLQNYNIKYTIIENLERKRKKKKMKNKTKHSYILTPSYPLETSPFPLSLNCRVVYTCVY